MDGRGSSFIRGLRCCLEKQKIKGYLAEKWNLQAGLTQWHPYKSSKPLGQSGLVINGIPEKAGSYSVNVTRQISGAKHQKFSISLYYL